MKSSSDRPLSSWSRRVSTPGDLSWPRGTDGKREGSILSWHTGDGERARSTRTSWRGALEGERTCSILSSSTPWRPAMRNVHAQPVSHLWNGLSGTAPSQSTHSYGCEPEMGYGTGKPHYSTRKPGLMGSPVEEAEAFLSFFRICCFTAACLFLFSASHILDVQSAQKWHLDSLVHPGAPLYMQDWHFSWLSSSLRKWEHPGKVRCSLRSCLRGSDISTSESKFYTHTVKTNQPACKRTFLSRKNGRLEGRQRIRINTIPQYPPVSKSTTRGRLWG